MTVYEPTVKSTDGDRDYLKEDDKLDDEKLPVPIFRLYRLKSLNKYNYYIQKLAPSSWREQLKDLKSLTQTTVHKAEEPLEIGVKYPKKHTGRNQESPQDL